MNQTKTPTNARAKAAYMQRFSSVLKCLNGSSACLCSIFITNDYYGMEHLNYAFNRRLIFLKDYPKAPYSISIPQIYDGYALNN